MLLLTLGVWLFLLVIVLVVAGVLVQAMERHKQRTKQRAMVEEISRMRSIHSTYEKISEFNHILLDCLTRADRRNVFQQAAEGFRQLFGLDKFVLYSEEKGMLSPLMGAGVNWRSMRPRRLEFSHHENQREPADGLTPLDAKLLAAQTQIQADPHSAVAFRYKFGDRQLVILAEDPKRNLAPHCTVEEFNRLVWPSLYRLCEQLRAMQRKQQRAHRLEAQTNGAEYRVDEIATKAQQEFFTLEGFMDLSNKLFNVFDERRLFEILTDKVWLAFGPRYVAVFGADEDGTWRLRTSRGQCPSELKDLEVSPDWPIMRGLLGGGQPLNLTVPGIAVQEDSPLAALSEKRGLSLVAGITAKGELIGLLFVGAKRNASQYNQVEINLLSAMTQMASLAAGNIQQYRLIEKMSYTDSMTELYNYRYFYKRLNEEIYRARRFHRALALVIFDIDNFKAINDSFGHQAGDEVLKSLAAMVTSSVRAIDVVSRYGGEEFCIIMPDTDRANCGVFVERLRRAIMGHRFTAGRDGPGCQISVSIGAAIFPDDAQAADRLIYCADMALLKAKAMGRNRSVIFDVSMFDDADLKAALSKKPNQARENAE